MLGAMPLESPLSCLLEYEQDRGPGDNCFPKAQLDLGEVTCESKV